MRPLILGDLSKRTQTRGGSGVVFNFVDGRSRIFLLEGGWWVSRTHIPDQDRLLHAHERSAKVGLYKTAPAKNGSVFL